MKIIALEEHFILPREEQNLPPGAQRGNDREKLLGLDIVAELLDLGDRRIAAMDAAAFGIPMDPLVASFVYSSPGKTVLYCLAASLAAAKLPALAFRIARS